MTVPTNLLIDNSYSTDTSTRTLLWPIWSSSRELRLSYFDTATISHLIDTYGVTRRGAAAVRDYLDNR